jgi:ornithine cyclodeaminase/alanine dehydrogenase-like protein (mu-crystallin family)
MYVMMAGQPLPPLFGRNLLAANALTVAVGSREPDAREADDDIVSDSFVVVESAEVACQEAGEIVCALDVCGVRPSLHSLTSLVCGTVRPQESGPHLFNSAGMGWENIAVAMALYDSSCPPTRRQCDGVESSAFLE